MTKERALELLEIYGRAWETRDPDLIVTIFSENATYLDPAEPENIGREAIRHYWQYKVVGEQEDIKFKLKNCWIDTSSKKGGGAVIAEWNATFRDIKRNVFVDMDEVAIFSIDGEIFGSLREYYKSTKTPLV